MEENTGNVTLLEGKKARNKNNGGGNRKGNRKKL